MLERDPELDAMLAPERQEPPMPPAALNERLWRRISDSVRAGAGPARGPVGPALLIITGLLGVAVGAWAVSSFRAQPDVPAPTVEAPKVERVVDAGPPAPQTISDETTTSPRAAEAGARPTDEDRFLDRESSRLGVREALKKNQLLQAGAALAKHEADYPEDDVREEREALLVLTAAFSQSTALPRAAAAFRARYPDSGLLLALPTPQNEASPGRPVAPRDGGCTVNGRLGFSTNDPTVHVSDVVVYAVTAARSGMRTSPVNHQVVVEPREFTPKRSIIQRLDSVTLELKDRREHGVFTSDRSTLRLRLLPRRNTTSEPVVFDTFGSFRLQCDVHANERGFVVVVPDARFVTSVADDGAWQLDGVPPGKVKVSILEPNGARFDVVVNACSSAPIDSTLEGNEPPVLTRFNGSPYGEYQQ